MSDYAPTLDEANRSVMYDSAPVRAAAEERKDAHKWTAYGAPSPAL